jgi:DNA polymerase-3 subunit delta'
VLALHPATQKTLEALTRTLPQSLLISGQRGVGLKAIAVQLAGKHLAGEICPQDAKEHTDNENGTISVEMIRRLYRQTRAKHTSRQVVIIDDADKMSRGAQSAFLKLLEEPNEHIYFILTSHRPQNLLPTIRSRVQHTVVHPVSSTQTSDFIASLGVDEPTKKTQLQFIAEGLPAELTRLVHDESYFKERAAIISDVRDFLQGDPYKKLLVIQKYKANRDDTLQFIESAMQVLRCSISAKPQQSLVIQLERLLTAREQIAANCNISLQLTQFVL